MNPKSGRWGGWRLPINIWVPITFSPITLHPKQEAPSTTAPHLPQQHKEKEWGWGAPKVIDPKSMGPCGGKNSSSPFEAAVLPQRQSSLHPLAFLAFYPKLWRSEQPKDL